MPIKDSSIFLIEELKKMFRLAYFASSEAHELLFVDIADRTRENEVIAGLHINKAISIMYSARSIYINNIDELEHNDVDTIFSKFDIFESEVLTNIRTNHSHQWSDIEYRQYKDALSILINID